MGDYIVVSFHLNVGTGDSAIHLAVTPTSVTGKIGAVQHAVLIDGGFPKIGFPQIEKTITQIEKNYQMPDGFRLKFDSIVITHWDGDHYGGIIDLINLDLMSSIERDPTVDLRKLKCNRMRYDEGKKAQPQTKFFVARWESRRKTKAAPALNGHQTCLRRTIFPGKPDRYLLDFRVSTKPAEWVPGICELLPEAGDALAYELFTGTPWSGDKPTTLEELALSLTAPKPGLFIVAGDQQVLPMEKGGADGIARRSKPGPDLPDITGRPDPNGNNLTSIVTILVWPDRRVSHYSAGDADDSLEERVAEWLSQMSSPLKGGITTLKISHHGAATSSPEVIFNAYSPKSLIASAGQMHFHPRWELLLYLDLWKRVNSPDLPVLWPTCYPYYLKKSPPGRPADNNSKKRRTVTLWNEATSKEPSFAALLESPIFTNYQTLLTRLATQLKEDPVTLFRKSVDRQEQVDWVFQKVEALWPRLSKVLSAANPASSSTSVGSSGMCTIGPDQHIQYVEVISSQLASVDGQVSLILADGSNLAAWTSPTKSAKRETSTVVDVPLHLRDGYRNTRAYAASVRNVAAVVDGARDARRTRSNSFTFSTDTARTTTSGPVGTSPQTQTLPIDPNHFFYLSSMYVPPDPPQTGYLLLTAGTPIEIFVGWLHSGVLALVDAPTDEGTALALDDEWFAWLHGPSVLWATQLLVLSAENDNVITGYLLRMTIPSTVIVGNSSLPWSLSFSGAQNQDVFSVQSIQDYMDGLGHGFVTGTLLLAIQPTTQPCVVTEVFGIFGVPLDLVVGLADDISLQIDSSEGSRSAIWVTPEADYQTVLRLQFTVPETGKEKELQKLQAFLNVFLNGTLTVQSFTAVGRKTLRHTTFAGQPPGGASSSPTEQVLTDAEVILSITARYEESPGLLRFDVLFYPVGTEYILSFDENSGKIGDLLQWLNKSLPAGIPTMDKFMPQWAIDAGNAFSARRIAVRFDGKEIVSFRLDVEVLLTFGHSSDDDTQVCLLLTYLWPKSAFVGTLWAHPPEPLEILKDCDIPYELDPFYERFRDFQPWAPTTRGSVSLTNLSPEGPLGTQPTGVPPEVMNVEIELDTDPCQISFSGNLVCFQPPDGTYKVPTITLDIITLSCSYTWPSHEGANDSQLECSLSGSFDLISRTLPGTDEPQFPTATLYLSIDYDSMEGAWTLTGEVCNLNLALLYSFFDDGADAMMNLLESITVVDLYLQYIYEKGTGHASDFTFTGVVLLGDDPETETGGLELDLFYHHGANPDSASQSNPTPPESVWQFRAELGANTRSQSTLGQVVGSVAGSDVAGILPSFVSGINIQADTVSDAKDLAAGASSSVSLSVTASPTDANLLIFQVRITFGDGFAVTFVQLSKKDAAAGESPKRVVKLSTSELPGADNVPLVGHVPQPYDELDFVWVHDESSDGGLLRKEIAEINAAAFDPFGIPSLMYKEVSKDPSADAAKPVLTAGSHFLIIVNSLVSLDYHISSPSPNPSPTPNLAGRATAELQAGGGVDDDPSDDDPQDTQMGVAGKKFGPLTIQNVGLRFQSGVISLVMDAIFDLGTIELALLGFGMGFDMTGFTLHQLPPVDKFIPELSGLAVSFNDGVMQMSGVFEKSGPDTYLGGIVMAMEEYSFLAVGAYSKQTINNQDFKSFFVFLQADGPLVELEFAELTGIKAGFGYNSYLTYPSLANVMQFPLIGDNLPDPGGDPLAVLLKLCDQSTGAWVQPRNGPLWIAAGLSANAFDLLVADSVTIIEFNPLSLGIFAEVVAALPQNEPPQDCFVYAELGLVAKLDFSTGTLVIAGQLTPNSFVITPSCHLTGGFALAQWFANSNFPGDWVFTVGGYHPQFIKPDHYPTVERLGIYWSLDSNLSITGQAYFAITPKAAMGGGVLNAVFSLGPLGAYFNAYADFLFNFSPFHFFGEIGVDIGVSFTLDLWICTIYISVNVGANLVLQGCPVGGVATVDFFLFSFDIYFGDQPSGPVPLSLTDFWALLVQQNPSPTFALQAPERMGDTTVTEITLDVPTIDDAHLLVVQDGLITSKSKGKNLEMKKGEIWNVKGGQFKFLVQSRFAIKDAVVTGGATQVLETDFYSKPMQLCDAVVSSHLEIEVSYPRETIRPFRLQKVIKAVPTSTWGKYIPSEDPNGGSDTSGLLDGTVGATMELMMSVSVTAPLPVHSTQNLTFNADTMTTPVFEPSETPNLPPSLPPQGLWTPQPPIADPAHPTAQWDAVRNAWENPPETWPTLLVGTWGNLFKWKPPVDDQLIPIPPVSLLKPKNFYLYPEAPVLSAPDGNSTPS